MVTVLYFNWLEPVQLVQKGTNNSLRLIRFTRESHQVISVLRTTVSKFSDGVFGLSGYL